MKSHAASFRMPARADAFEAALEGLTRVNENLIGAGGIPPLYEAGVRYRHEPKDVWRHASDVLGERWGDCEDLSAYRAAELRVSGEDPGARVTTYQSGPNRYHAVVLRGDGTMEDPSRVLGMGQPAMRRTASANIIGSDFAPSGSITFELIKVPAGFGKRGGYRGYLKIPLGTLPGMTAPVAQYTVGPQAPTPAAAQAAAVKSAGVNLNSVLNNPLVKTGLSFVPGGSTAAAVLTNPAVQAVAKKIPGISKLFG